MRLHTSAHGFTKRFDIGRRRAAKIHPEVAVELGHLRAANCKPSAAGIVYHFPDPMAWWVFESGAAGAVARLACLPPFLDRRHFGSDLLGLTEVPLQNGRSKNHIVWHAAITIGKAHFAVAKAAHVAVAVNCLRFN